MHHVHILNGTESNAYFDFNDFYRLVTKKKYWLFVRWEYKKNLVGFFLLLKQNKKDILENVIEQSVKEFRVLLH